MKAVALAVLAGAACLALVAALVTSGDGADRGRPATAAGAATGSTYEPLVALPGLASVAWRCDDQRRLALRVRVPRRGATVRVTIGEGAGRTVHPGRTVHSGPGAERRRVIRLLQETAPMTRRVRIVVELGVRPVTGLCVIEAQTVSERRRSTAE